MKRAESLPPLDTDDATTDAEKNVVLRDAIDKAARNDPTRFTTRSFAVLENKDHSLRLINRDDASKAISIPWDELSALRTIIDIATQNTTSADATTPPTSPSDAAMRAAEEILTTVLGFNELDDLASLSPENGNRKHVESEIAAIITRHLPQSPEREREIFDAGFASPETPVGGEAQRFVAAAFAYLNTIAGGDICNDRTCIRCRIADAAFEVQRSSSGVSKT